jgi:hypothetical protein
MLRALLSGSISLLLFTSRSSTFYQGYFFHEHLIGLGVIDPFELDLFAMEFVRDELSCDRVGTPQELEQVPIGSPEQGQMTFLLAACAVLGARNNVAAIADECSFVLYR